MQRVLITGATGFVGRRLVRRLLDRGWTVVGLSRHMAYPQSMQADVEAGRFVPVAAALSDVPALKRAMEGCRAVVHLVGIIIERPGKGQTFDRVHRRGTEGVVKAARESGVERFVHMSALGTRPEAVSKYHRTKWAAEQIVRDSGLAWTIFRPSLIHGPDSEFMRLMKMLACGWFPPAMPYFGSGRARLQPVFVEDVAECFAESLTRTEAIGQVYPLGGPRAYTWKEFYNACRTLIPGGRTWKPLVPQPAPIARLMAAVSGPVLTLLEKVVPSAGLLRFSGDMVQMALEDNVCDHTIAEAGLAVRMRAFEEELARYADNIE